MDPVLQEIVLRDDANNFFEQYRRGVFVLRGLGDFLNCFCFACLHNKFNIARFMIYGSNYVYDCVHAYDDYCNWIFCNIVRCELIIDNINPALTFLLDNGAIRNNEVSECVTLLMYNMNVSILPKIFTMYPEVLLDPALLEQAIVTKNPNQISILMDYGANPDNINRAEITKHCNACKLKARIILAKKIFGHDLSRMLAKYVFAKRLSSFVITL